MTQPHEFDSQSFKGDPERPWQIPPEMGDQEIIEHLRMIKRPYSKKLSMTGMANRIINDEMILAYSGIEKSPIAYIIIAREKDRFVIVGNDYIISQRWSNPRPSEINFLTTTAQMTENRHTAYVGETYRIDFNGTRNIENWKIADLKLSSTKPIELQGMLRVRDYNAYLESLRQKKNA